MAASKHQCFTRLQLFATEIETQEDCNFITHTRPKLYKF